jgi:predicted esterase
VASDRPSSEQHRRCHIDRPKDQIVGQEALSPSTDNPQHEIKANLSNDSVNCEETGVGFQQGASNAHRIFIESNDLVDAIEFEIGFLPLRILVR